MKWGRKPPVKVEVEGYAPCFVRTLTRGEARELLDDKFKGQAFAAALVGLSLCDYSGARAVLGTIEEVAAVAEDMDMPLFEAVAEAASAATFPKRAEGKAEAIPGGG